MRIKIENNQLYHTIKIFYNINNLNPTTTQIVEAEKLSLNLTTQPGKITLDCRLNNSQQIQNIFS